MTESNGLRSGSSTDFSDSALNQDLCSGSCDDCT
jgi:hypothetical protein